MKLKFQSTQFVNTKSKKNSNLVWDFDALFFWNWFAFLMRNLERNFSAMCLWYVMAILYLLFQIKQEFHKITLNIGSKSDMFQHCINYCTLHKNTSFTLRQEIKLENLDMILNDSVHQKQCILEFNPRLATKSTSPLYWILKLSCYLCKVLYKMWLDIKKNW